MRYEIPAAPPARRRLGPILLIIVILALLLGARILGGYVIEYNWWKEMGQVSTWVDMLLYQLAPVAAASLLAFIVLFAAHARGLRFAGARLGRYPLYAKLSTVALLLLAILIAAATIETWTAVRFFGGRHLGTEAAAWRDPVFDEPLKFYLFDLPFYSVLRSYALTVTIAALLIYWLAARAWQLRDRFADIQESGQFDIRLFGLQGALESRFLRAAGAALLVFFAFQFFLGRYEMLWSNHGFMVGVDYVDQNITLPLQWLVIFACIAAAALLLIGRWKWILLVAGALILKAIVPAIVGAVYVRPNEISIERPFVQRHIQATRSAFGLDRRLKEAEFPARLQGSFDPAKYDGILSNVRLWDWRAFHDTITQIQALRPYYTFADTDVDRYVIDGQLRQTLLSPRELDLRLLPGEARNSWPNTHVIYTHGYGMVMAEANRITGDGLPVLFIQDAPPVVKSQSLKLLRPELYYSEITHEPVFVRTAQGEFNYPSGADNKFTRYSGKGGFPASSFGMRLAAALQQGDPNILLTSYLTAESRMMIRRNVRERVQALAGFLSWETDPYLVLTDEGHLVWTIDGYTTSDAHPYSRQVGVGDFGSVNYMRNAVKATIEAYDGNVHLYIFDTGDPIIRAYQKLFPRLFEPFSAMPADLRRHARYPETLFRVQAEMYRTFHMLDPQAFYNREDLWDIARAMQMGDSGRLEAKPMAPTYVVASLPGQTQAEFLLMIPFTPRNKDNLIGLMVARCDGAHLGELNVLQLSKQELIYGPMQIDARINQDQNISKDLTLWGQQGSQVVRGQMLVLPIDDTFLYIEPLYIQSSEARMPQLKKIALAMGNVLIYTDTYEQAMAQLSAAMQGAAPAQPAPGTQPRPAVTAPAPSGAAAAAVPLQQRLDSIRQHLDRYRQLASQGRWAEAGKELEAIQAEAARK